MFPNKAIVYYLEFKLRYLKNVKLFSKNIIEPWSQLHDWAHIVLRKKKKERKKKATVFFFFFFLLFFKGIFL